MKKFTVRVLLDPCKRLACELPAPVSAVLRKRISSSLNADVAGAAGHEGPWMDP